MDALLEAGPKLRQLTLVTSIFYFDFHIPVLSFFMLPTAIYVLLAINTIGFLNF
jgi:hypothetical protein